MATLITLLTDFGYADSYVGEVKGVLLSQVHGAALVDITHQVPPGDVRRRAVRPLARVAPLPAGERASRGRGPGRRHRAPRAGGIVGGTFLRRLRTTACCRSCRRMPTSWGCPSRTTPRPPSKRANVFCRPWRASSLSRAALTRGSSGHRCAPLADPRSRPRRHGLIGEVILRRSVRHAGLEHSGDAVEPGIRIKVGGTEVGTLSRTFGDVGRGALVAFVGSGGTVEIALRDGSAARLLGVGVGAEVRA